MLNSQRIDDPAPDYDDLMMYSEEETSFARRRYRRSSAEGRRQLIEAIIRAEAFLASAKEALRG